MYKQYSRASRAWPTILGLRMIYSSADQAFQDFAALQYLLVMSLIGLLSSPEA